MSRNPPYQIKPELSLARCKIRYMDADTKRKKIYNNLIDLAQDFLNDAIKLENLETKSATKAESIFNSLQQSLQQPIRLRIPKSNSTTRVPLRPILESSGTLNVLPGIQARLKLIVSIINQILRMDLNDLVFEREAEQAIRKPKKFLSTPESALACLHRAKKERGITGFNYIDQDFENRDIQDKNARMALNARIHDLESESKHIGLVEENLKREMTKLKTAKKLAHELLKTIKETTNKLGHKVKPSSFLGQLRQAQKNFNDFTRSLLS
jgi:hypothetical protein